MAVFPQYRTRGMNRTAQLPIAASQTFAVNDFVTLNTSTHLVQQAVAAGSNVGAVATTAIANKIAGQAVQAAQPATGSDWPTNLSSMFTVAEPGTQFSMPLYHGTAASAYPTPALLGLQYELRNENTVFTGYCVDIGSTTNPKCKIVDYAIETYLLWPNVGQSSAPSSGTFSQYANTWVEFCASTSALTGAGPITFS